VFEILDRDAECRSEAEDEAAEERDADSEEQNAPVDVNFVGAGKTARPKRDKWADTNRSECDAERSSSQAEQGTFGETLAHEAAEPSAEGDAHGEFTFARNGTRERKTGDVDAGDE
jgi:hypothetical protein